MDIHLRFWSTGEVGIQDAVSRYDGSEFMSRPKTEDMLGHFNVSNATIVLEITKYNSVQARGVTVILKVQRRKCPQVYWAIYVFLHSIALLSPLQLKSHTNKKQSSAI